MCVTVHLGLPSLTVCTMASLPPLARHRLQRVGQRLPSSLRLAPSRQLCLFNRASCRLLQASARATRTRDCGSRRAHRPIRAMGQPAPIRTPTQQASRLRALCGGAPFRIMGLVALSNCPGVKEALQGLPAKSNVHGSGCLAAWIVLYTATPQQPRAQPPIYPN